MKNKNCPNCAAPYDLNLIKCPYCGTIYFDFPALDIEAHEPVWLRFKRGNVLILHKAYLSNVSMEVSSSSVIHGPIEITTKKEVKTILEFESCGDTSAVDKTPAIMAIVESDGSEEE